MKARFLALAALVLGLASCQTEPEGLDVNVGGEVETTVCVSLPEATRAADSAEGAFKNLVNSDEYTIRYIFQVFYKDTESKAARQVIYSDGNTVSFPVRLVPGRDYNFVAWADVVPQADKTLDVLGEYNKESDFRYNTENLEVVTFKGDWLAMDETFDAYTDAQTIEYYGTSSINLNLTRPFAKLRVMTTDMVELRNLQIVPEGVNVAYTVPVYKSFDVTAQAANTAGASTHTFTYNLSEVQEYTTTETTSTLFTNYLFGAENGIVKFTMDVNDNTSVAELIKSNNFNTDIPVQRNYLTTISGNILTDGNNVKVDIVEDGAFEGEKEWPEENNSSEQLAYAAMFGGEVTLTEDVVLTQPLTIVDGANVVINLNGKTITGASVKGEGAIIENNGILTLVGGTIKNTETNGDAVINNNGELVLDGVKIEGAPIGTTNYPNYAVYTSGKLVVEEGTQIISDRGALSMVNGVDVTINGGEFIVTNAVGTRTLTAHVIYAYGRDSKLTINDGNFAMNIANGGGSSVICPAGATIKVYGGNFYHAPVSDSQSGCFQNYMGYGAPVDVYGGVFNDDTVTKSGNLADGYKAVMLSDGNYVVVAEEIDNVVDSPVSAQSALDNADANTTIQLQPGNYGTLLIRPVAGAANTVTGTDYLAYRNEMLRKVENLTIVGTPGAKVDAIKVVAGYIEGSTGYVVDIKNLVIDSVEFTDTNSNAPIYFNLTYTNVDGLTVNNCKLVGNNPETNLVRIYTDGPIANSTFNTPAKNITLTNNTVDGIARLCELRQAENVTITNNTIKNTALHGILLSAYKGTYSGNVTITNNIAEGINERFVRMASADNAVVVVKDNTIINYKGADADVIKVTDGSNVTIENITMRVLDQQQFNVALGNNFVNNIILGTGEFKADLYANNVARESLTISGTEGSKLAFLKGQVRAELFNNLTIKNCEILRMAEKSWGMLVFSTGKENGVYTVENCTFNGVQTQGIYINENYKATYNIKNCTFNGDFTCNDGAITIQNNAGVKSVVNVTGCEFTNFLGTKIFVLYNNNDMTLNNPGNVDVVCGNR